MTTKAFKKSVGMSVEEGVKKAIEGGYRDKNFIFEFNADYNIRSSTLLDPLFWIALGKAEGWGSQYGDKVCVHPDCIKLVKKTGEEHDCFDESHNDFEMEAWLAYWLKFISTLASLAKIKRDEKD